MRLNDRPTRKYTAALLIALSLMAPVAAESKARDTRANGGAVERSRIRIDNFGRVNSNYYRGAQPKDHDYADLAALGVKTLINLTSDDADLSEKAMVQGAGMKYVQIPMTTHEPPTAAQLAEFLRIVDDPSSQPVYVHCVGGRHRTGVMTAVYRMTQDGWTGAQAFKEMKQYNFGADFLHPEFKRFVLGYAGSPAHLAPSQTAIATKSGS